MKQIFKFMLIGSIMLWMQTTYAIEPTLDDPSNFLGPSIRIGVTDNMTNTSAYSFAGELGFKNYRLNGTVGWQMLTDQRFKISAEYLSQNITYAFLSGNVDQWMRQGAVGFDYLYDLNDYLYRPQFNLNAYLSYAPSKTLGTETSTFTNSFGFMQQFVEYRRIAGSKAGGLSPGVMITPWLGGKIGAELNYDKVYYDTVYSGNEVTAGFGGTVRVNQAISDDVAFNLLAAVRQPFNNYQAGIAWSNIPFHGKWTVGLQGQYTSGKDTLPDTYNVGLTADYFFDEMLESPMAQPDGIDRFMKANSDVTYKGLSLSEQTEKQDFLTWVAKPAVYMPQVLAIADAKVVCPDGEAPIALRNPIDPDTNPTELGGVNIASYFSGSNLTFSKISVTPDPATYPGDFVNVSTSGILTFDATGAAADDTRYTVVIRASNACGAVESSIVIGPLP